MTKSEDDRWATSTDPDELLGMVGKWSRWMNADDSLALTDECYRRTEHIRASWPDPFEGAPDLTSPTLETVKVALRWAREVEVQAARKWNKSRSWDDGEIEFGRATVWVERYADHAARAYQCSAIRMAVGESDAR